MPGLDPFKLTELVKKRVTRIRNGVEELRYYRFRGGRWYGGIATGDVVGCNLRCKFCWSWRYSYFTDKGFFCNPIEVFEKLVNIASRRGYRYVRLSGGEPTIAWDHLIELLKLFSETKYTFILETNGLLIGRDINKAKDLAKFNNVVVRVSFKGTTSEEFEYLTGADREYYKYQFKALENLYEAGLEPGKDFYAAAMLSFSPEENIKKFLKKLSEIHPVLAEDLDVEYVILYPHVVKLLKMNRLKPRIAYRPDGIPEFMI
ncbi:MAG: radical SAM protein [Thermoprotei archaeon]